jgi:hypothetical protein
MSTLVIGDLNRAEGLSSSDMSQVTGGMSCQAAMAVAQVYIITSGILGGLGSAAGGSEYAGKAQGVLEGACPAPAP